MGRSQASLDPWYRPGAFAANQHSQVCGVDNLDITSEFVYLHIFPKYFTLKLKSAIIGRDILGTINTRKRHRDQFGNVCSLKDVFLRPT